MNEVGKPSGLTKRKGSPYWYFRKRWPKAYQRPGTPPEIWISLETAVYAEALQMLDDIRLEANRRFKALSSPLPPSGIYSRSAVLSWPSDAALPLLTQDQAGLLAQAYFQDEFRALDLEPAAPKDVGDDWLKDYRIEVQDRLARLTNDDPDDPVDDVTRTQMAVLHRAGLRSAPGDEASQLLWNYLRRAMVQIEALRLARLAGNFADNISDRLFTRAALQKSDAPKAKIQKSNVTFGQAIDRYQSEALDMRSVTAKTSLKHRSLLRHIGSFFGRETLLVDIERADCNRFRDTLSKLQPNFMKAGGGRSLAEMAAQHVEERTLAWETQNNYLKRLDLLMGWCLKERLVADNPASDISPLKKREGVETQRLPFRAPELQRIFAAPIFVGCVDDERGFAKPGPNIIRRSRYWLPLIALFTGMRMGEILQLTPSHVRMSPAGNWFIVLTPDMTLKTISAEREIPIHNLLEKVGFVAWVEEKRRKGADEVLFDEVAASKHGYRSDTFTKRFATFLKRIDVPAERRSKLCFHSLRHTFKDALNDTDTPDWEMDEICGWSRAKKTGRRYGSGLSADRLKPYVDQVTFAIDLAHLIRG